MSVSIIPVARASSPAAVLSPRRAQSLLAAIDAAATPDALDALARQLRHQLAPLLVGTGVEARLAFQRVMLAISLRRAELQSPRPSARTGGV